MWMAKESLRAPSGNLPIFFFNREPLPRFTRESWSGPLELGFIPATDDFKYHVVTCILSGELSPKF